MCHIDLAYTGLDTMTFMKSDGETIDILQNIDNVEEFGKLLLNDPDGTLVAEIMSDSESPEAMKQRIIGIWMDGYGERPISWETLAGIVEGMGLSDLAEDIRQTLCNTEDAQGGA